MAILAQKEAVANVLNPIDRYFGGFIGRLSGGNPNVQLAAMLVSYFRGLGHICLDLQAFDGSARSLPEELKGEMVPSVPEWIKVLRASPVVGKPGEFKPLILDDDARLYLHRYWEYENDLTAAIRRWTGEKVPNVDWQRLMEGLAKLFPTDGEFDWQMLAAFAAVRNRFCVISGGPGTGKTRTVVMLLTLLLEQPSSDKLRIALVAPTGKAAARLQEAVKNAKGLLPCSQEIKDRLPEQASTIHRLLHSIPNSAYFRHDRENHLPVDVVVIDEASMVDLALMAKLIAAIPSSARLILLGDKDQLASVEAGAVLADICNSGAARAFSKEFTSEFLKVTGREIPASSANKTTPLSDCIIELRKNYRFGERSQIYGLSRAVNDGDADTAVEVMRRATASGAEVSWSKLPASNELKQALKTPVLSSYADYLQAKEPVQALKSFGRFRILCAVRHGPYGVENINRLAEEILTEAGLIEATARFYAGKPVLISRNNYNLRLFNGDIGILLRDSQRGELRGFFSGSEESLRDYLPLQLPEHETAFALTVHKSQGSEFERVLLILPGEDSAILTRELIYTGLTRASREVELWSNEGSFRTAVQRKIMRRSGLREALWEKSSANP
jgi:exodeoxyribonuclease V alpha subunit